jgi:hypothetical protein
MIVSMNAPGATTEAVANTRPSSAVAAALVIEKYTRVLAAADLFAGSTTSWVMESIRLALGYGSQVHP